MEPTRIKSTVTTMHQCPDCLENHETKSQAQKCCREIEKVFICDECGDEHESKASAGACCAMWECSWCGDQFDSATEATECCSEEWEDA